MIAAGDVPYHVDEALDVSFVADGIFLYGDDGAHIVTVTWAQVLENTLYDGSYTGFTREQIHECVEGLEGICRGLEAALRQLRPVIHEAREELVALAADATGAP